MNFLSLISIYHINMKLDVLNVWIYVTNYAYPLPSCQATPPRGLREPGLNLPDSNSLSKGTMSLRTFGDPFAGFPTPGSQYALSSSPWTEA